MSQVDALSTTTRPAKDVVANVLERWAKGQEPDAQAALKEHPELQGDHEAVTDLAFGEFCQRLERGEFVNPRAFADHFPTCRSTLFRIMNGHQLTVDNPGLLADPPRKKWPEPGESFVGFSVVRELGRGAFARVYLATEPALGGRSVVLKVGRHGNAEAEILGRLRHDNIVPVYAMREDLLTGMTVVCMPYLGATTLADVLEHTFARPGMPAHAAILLEAAQPKAEEAESLGPQRPSPILANGTYVEGVLDMGIQLAEALAFVHERKIYHRDLKPSNVLVRPDGRPMLLDFNLSFDQQAAQQTLGGTLIYMAPEMLRAIANKNADPCLLDGRSDLYSLGIILYEMLSGEHPFEEVFWGKSAEENRQRLAELQKTALRPLRDANPQVDKKVAGVVDRCLAYEPGERFQSAAELARALRGCLSRPQRWRRRLARHPYAVLAAGLAAVVLAAAIAVFFAVREPYPERQLKAGLRAFEQGQYSEAIDHLSLSLAEAESPEAYLARGRAYLKAGKHNAAEDDFKLADKLRPTGQTQAALGYCYSVMGKDELAVFCYKGAIKRGFESAVAFNNLGFSLMCQGTDEEAASYFQKAINTDPRLQIANYNRAALELKKACHNTDLMTEQRLKESRDAIDSALELGPATAIGFIHRDAARLYVLAAGVEPRWEDLAFEHLAKAIEGGVPPASLNDDPYLRPLQGDARFQRLMEKPIVKVPVMYNLRLLKVNLPALEPKARAYREMQKTWMDPGRIQSQRIWSQGVKDGLDAIARAIELGPATAQHHLVAARLCVVGAKIELRWKERALDHLAAAIDLGLPPASLKGDLILRPLQGDQFKRLTERPAVNSGPTLPIRFLDPFENR
jgi:serine/threonine protein kinase/Flp pilus assembly protein TadD